MRVTIALGWFLGLALGVGAPTQIPPVVEFHPPPAPEQPIAYSHKAHIALGLACQQCHDGATIGARANLPTTGTCLACHTAIKAESPEVQKIAAFDAKHEAIPWKRVYRLPDFVYFEHVRHVSAAPDITCETCHGPIAEMVVTQKVKDTSMAACVQCHTARGAATRCDSCHEPKG